MKTWHEKTWNNLYKIYRNELRQPIDYVDEMNFWKKKKKKKESLGPSPLKSSLTLDLTLDHLFEQKHKLLPREINRQSFASFERTLCNMRFTKSDIYDIKQQFAISSLPSTSAQRKVCYSFLQ